MTDSHPDDPVDRVAAAEAEMEDDATDRVTDALAGLAFCLVALQFTVAGVFDGSSFLTVLAGVGLGGFGVVKALNA
ncbi:hypothetical protein [Halobacterium jilantaiense]|uniref:Uncharacterized protein n=1 Tax=Halobacterium jilantaiense TaxID=355548 RepID=A0A1I0NQ12_9EURY|nr:hypothetical protein [Halobacterium jilantaiense]SEW03579.1 hypothetical protein SAMN04487945_1058 [Halobacterium jilantaiense]